MASRGLDPASWLALGLAVAGASLWYAVARPWWIGRAQAADLRGLARRGEQAHGALQGRLITVAGRLEGLRGAESPVLLARIARGAVGPLSQVGDHDVLPGRSVAWRWAGAGVAWALAGWMVTQVPGGAGGIASWLSGGAGPTGSQEWGDSEEALARVGDLTLRYTYPDYTGLEPYEVPNSSGEVRAVPGTEVEVVARSADVVSSAAVEAYGEAALEARVHEDGRTVEGRFSVRAEEGIWRIRTSVSGSLRRSPDYPIRPEADLPPEVSLDLGDRLVEIHADEALRGTWSARDDFGVSVVRVEVDGQPVRKVAEPRTRRTSLEEPLILRPAELGMVPGKTYEVRIAAWDNDTISGEKAGYSEVVRVVVLDEAGLARLDDERRRALLDVLVDVLGDFLEEVYPPGTQQRSWARWGRVVNDRYTRVTEALAPYRSDRRGVLPELWPLEQVVDDGRALIRYTQVAFPPTGTEAVDSGSRETADELRRAAIDSVEDAVLYLDGMLSASALRRVRLASRRMIRDGEALQARLAGVEDVAGVGLEMVRARELAEELADPLRQLRDPSLKDFGLDRVSEVDRVASASQGALDADDAERGRLFGARAADRMAEAGAAILAEIKRREQRDEQAQEDAQDLLEMLREIADDQGALAHETSSIRQSRDAALQQDADERWEQVVDLAKRAAVGAEGLSSIIGSRDRFNELVFLEAARANLDRLLSAVEGRDLAGARDEAEMADRHWQAFAYRWELINTRPSAQEARNIRDVAGVLREATERLEGLRRLDAQPVPGEARILRSTAGQQGSLSSRLARAQGQAAQVIRELPVTPKRVEPLLELAAERMEDASRSIAAAEVMTTEGSQRAAEQHVRDAIEDLLKAMEQAAAMAQEASESGGGGSSDDPSGEGEDEQGGDGGDQPRGGGGDDNFMDRFADAPMPEGEDFVPPEVYRRMLLEGMEGQVPDAFEALKRRYYEDLVRQ